MALIRAVVDFDKPLRDWDGFGVNYVEACQTRDYERYPQDYGGFRYLNTEQQREIIDMVFGDDGLKPGLVKMFLDCWHQPEPYGPYNHDQTTRSMMTFVEQGNALTRARGDELAILTTLYGPPAWMTRQQFVRGRDLDPAHAEAMADYMIDWARVLREQHNLPVKAISLHNEGEDWPRWPLDGADAGDPGHDYNLYWPPEQVAQFVGWLSEKLAARGMADVAVTPGECTGWYRFHAWGYADAIADDSKALAGIGLITSHGFKGGDIDGDWFNDWRSAGIDLLREYRPKLHAWVTSTSWSKMDVLFLEEMRQNIYSAKVNAIIPWACIQLQGHWEGGDPNPGTAFRVYSDGTYEVTKGYFFFKQISRAGQAGMSVCRALCNDRRIGLIAFGANGTQHQDVFLALNLSDQPRTFDIQVNGSHSHLFSVVRTSPDEDYLSLAPVSVQSGVVTVTLPPLSATTFFGCP